MELLFIGSMMMGVIDSENDEIKYYIAKEFTTQPGPRKKNQGEKSGQEFYEDVLQKLFFDAIKANKKLTIVFDGVDGINTGFIDESLGELRRKSSSDIFDKTLNVEWTGQKFLLKKIYEIIKP